MNNLRTFKQKLALVSRRWRAKDFDAALAEVEALRKDWPGNAHLNILWASLVQLTEKPKQDLDDAKRALQQAIDLDKASPAAAIELGHFLDNVEDDPQAAAKAYAQGISAARQLLLEGLIGQAKALRQLDKRDDFLRCLVEVLQLARFETGPKWSDTAADIIFDTPAGPCYAVQVKGPYAEQVQELLNEVAADRKALKGAG